MSTRPRPPAAPLDSVRAVRKAMQLAALTPATRPGQVAVYLQLVLAAGLASAWADDLRPVVITAMVLGASAVVGIATEVGGWFRRASGVVVALGVLFVAIIVHALTDGRLLGEQASWVLFALALVPIGLDWRFVPRLRARAVCSGVVVIPLVGAHESWTFAGAVVWFVGAVATLWVLERDVERAAMRPARLQPAEPAAPLRATDLLRPIGAGLAVGLVLALLIGDVSCSPRPPSVGPGLDSPLPLSALDAQDFRPEADGSFSIEGPDGQRYALEPDGNGGWVVRDPQGDILVPDEHGEVVVPPAGRTTTVDGDRVIVEDADGTTRIFDHDGDGRARVRVQGPNGEERTYVYRDPDATLGPGNPGGSSTTPRSSTSDGDDGPPWRWIAAGLLAATAIAAGVVLLARRRRPAARAEHDWAHAAAARIEAEGRRRGLVRGRGETLVDYSASLVAGPLPDPRLLDVAHRVSAALFGRDAPDQTTRAWVDQTIEEITRAHPVRRRGRAPAAV